MIRPVSEGTVAVEALPPLREVIATHGLTARRHLGQHFLLDLNLTGRIARAAGDLSRVGVLEIGPGPGGLTRALLQAGAREVVAIERDKRCITALQDLVGLAGPRLRVIEADALGADAEALLAPPRAVVANLPYNISTVLLLGWLQRLDAFECLTLMFQREVADRLAAKPGSKDYGRLSVITQWRAHVRIVFNLPAQAFTPPPRVASTVVHVTPRTNAVPVEWGALERVTAAAFGQRRKMLRTSLKSLGDAEALLAVTGLDGTRRAEELDVDDFIRLARASESGHGRR